MADLKDLNDEEFMAQWDVAGEQLKAAQDRIEAFSIEQNRRVTLDTAIRKTAGLNDEERAALLQDTTPLGVESTSETGTPGGEQ